MSLRTRVLAVAAAVGLAGSLVTPAATAAEASPEPGTDPLINVLLADGDRFDASPYDFDIVTEAAKWVLKNKPDSTVAALTDGTVPLTAFIPNDRAFQLLVKDLTGESYGFYRFNERKVFRQVKTLGLDTVEAVLLYHVVPGTTIDKKTALQADGAVLDTALTGATIEVDVKSERWSLIRLKDADKDDRDPWIVRSKFDINKGNEQIAHGISRVLRPVDL